MSIIDAIKDAFAKVIHNLLEAVERLTTQEVVVSVDGEIVIREPLIKGVADKVSAVVLASAALFFLLSPIESKVAMALGDQLMRLATTLWSGGSNGESVPEAGFAV